LGLKSASNDLRTGQLPAAPRHRGRLNSRNRLRLLGPAFVAAIAYIDPGNYATNIEAGAKFGYLLLWVVLWANLVAVLIQLLSSKLGIATRSSLAMLIRDRLPLWASVLYWIQAEVLAIATDLAEFVGSALGFHLLFGVDLLRGGVLTGVASYAILLMERKGLKPLEIAIGTMLGAVALIYVGELILTRPDSALVLRGMLLPRFAGSESVFIAAGILGATVMPHVIYLHSSLSSVDAAHSDPPSPKAMLRASYWDVGVAMALASFVNLAMLAMAAATLHGSAGDVGSIEDAYRTLEPMLGPIALHIFGLSLVIAGISSTVVGTLAGQEVMQDFVHIRIPVWLRRAVTMVPSFIAIGLGADVTQILVVSQVVLSFGIALALLPLLLLTSSRPVMGDLVNHRLTTLLGWLCIAVVIVLNAAVLVHSFI
jgi:manganese transport protein